MSGNCTLEFDGRMVTLYRRGQGSNDENRRTKIKQVYVSTFLKELQKDLPITQTLETPALPEGTFYYARKGYREALVIEQPPETRTVTWSDLPHDETRQKKSARRYSLAFPYVVLVCIISDNIILDTHIFYRTAPLISLDDELYYTNFPNVFGSDNRICLGELSDFRGDLKKQAEQVLNRLWNACFNADLGGGKFTASKGMDKKISSVRAWEKASAKDEFFMLKIPWKMAYRTVRGAVRAICFSGIDEKNIISATDGLLDIFYRCAPEAKERPEQPEFMNTHEAGGGYPCG